MSQESVKQALTKTMGAIQKNPKTANVVFRAETAWEEDTRCTAQIRDFPAFTIDEPAELGGRDAAPNPVELVLAALGTCQEIMYSAYASVMDIPLDGVRVTARGYLDLHGLFGLDGEVPPGYKRIVFETDIESSASDDDLRRLVSTVEAHCPVLDILTREQQVSGSARVNGRVLSPIDVDAA